MKYICIKTLCLDRYDDDGSWNPDESTIVEAGEIWTEEKRGYNIIGPKEAIHLEKGIDWIEIMPETLKEYFEETKEGKDASKP